MTDGENRSKMIYAFNMMGVYGEHMRRTKSYAIVRAYERNRDEWRKMHSEKMTDREPWNKGKKLDDEKYKKAGRSNKGRVLSPEVAEAKRLRQIGRTMSAESSQKKRDAMIGFVRGPMSEEEKQKRRIPLIGKKKKEGHADNVRNAVLGNISINKDGIEKKIKKDVLQEYLDSGWQLGGRKRK
jgi:hypothetical protein